MAAALVLAQSLEDGGIEDLQEFLPDEGLAFGVQLFGAHVPGIAEKGAFHAGGVEETQSPQKSKEAEGQQVEPPPGVPPHNPTGKAQLRVAREEGAIHVEQGYHAAIMRLYHAAIMRRKDGALAGRRYEGRAGCLFAESYQPMRFLKA